jgi:hypothetical protein
MTIIFFTPLIFWFAIRYLEKKEATLWKIINLFPVPILASNQYFLNLVKAKRSE